MTPVQSAELVAALKALKVLDRTGTFTRDLQNDDRKWMTKLRGVLPWMRRGAPAYVLWPPKKSAIWQAMKVAQAGHEHVCDYLTAALMWFEAPGAATFEELAQKYRVARPALLTMARYSGEPAPAEAFASWTPPKRTLLDADDDVVDDVVDNDDDNDDDNENDDENNDDVYIAHEDLIE
jgi:hypothetical protein